MLRIAFGAGGRRANATDLPYKRMSYEEIAALPVGEMADYSCQLFLWSTRKTFREGKAAEIARAWGFDPYGEIIWGLTNPGTGAGLLRADHEPCLIASKGKGPKLAAVLHEPLGVWFWKQVYEYGPAGVPQKKHSAKPPGFLELVERLAEGPRLELFAREQRLGWDTWGNEALEHVEVA